MAVSRLNAGFIRAVTIWVSLGLDRRSKTADQRQQRSKIKDSKEHSMGFRVGERRSLRGEVKDRPKISSLKGRGHLQK